MQQKIVGLHACTRDAIIKMRTLELGRPVVALVVVVVAQKCKKVTSAGVAAAALLLRRLPLPQLLLLLHNELYYYHNIYCDALSFNVRIACRGRRAIHKTNLRFGSGAWPAW